MVFAVSSSMTMPAAVTERNIESGGGIVVNIVPFFIYIGIRVRWWIAGRRAWIAVMNDSSALTAGFANRYPLCAIGTAIMPCTCRRGATAYECGNQYQLSHG